MLNVCILKEKKKKNQIPWYTAVYLGLTKFVIIFEF